MQGHPVMDLDIAQDEPAAEEDQPYEEDRYHSQHQSLTTHPTDIRVIECHDALSYADERKGSPKSQDHHQVAFWKLVVAWQLLAIVLTGTGVFSQLLADKGFSIPTAQSCLNYFLLSFHCFILIKRRKTRSEKDQLAPNEPWLQIEWWKYLFLAICDIEGNYCLVRAYQYTTIASVQLLDCFTIPCVMALSLLFLNAHFNSKHIFGSILCLVGLTLLVWSDSTNRQPASDPVRGDLLVFLGCLLYSVSNVAQEHIVKNHDTVEFLGMLGLFGFGLSLMQVILFERTQILDADWGDSEAWSYLLGFSGCLFTLYVSIPRLLVLSSAVFMNLSFLTADFWALLFGVFLFGNSLTMLYFAAFAVIVTGLVVYNLASYDLWTFPCWQPILRRLGYEQPGLEVKHLTDPTAFSSDSLGDADFDEDMLN